ncbi:hypothetical protein VF21_05509 [Pseudogymnoascus sp. 05NY08]|nr:hypothetical protein VF21_05509 [Pseudogymnoascus sp. 05NY08]
MAPLTTKPAARLVRCNLPIYDFLTPRFSQTIRTRALHTSPRDRAAASAAAAPSPNTPPAPPTDSAAPSPTPSPTTKPSKPLTQAQRDFLSSALRVNQAGELAATLIYRAQTPPLIASHPHLRPLMKHMYDQEASHFSTFNALLARHRVRPTALYPVWVAAATALGWGTAFLGREAAMACTEAVETEIGGHYNEQVAVLLEMVRGMEEEGTEVGEELRGLVGEIRRIRDEELEHLDHAVQNDAGLAVPHELLTGVIRVGCRGAIWVSERV